MENNNNERLIYLSDLFFSILHGWKALIIVTLIFAFLLSGFSAYRSLSNANTLPSSAGSVTSEKTFLQAQADSLQQKVDHLRDYNSNALIMQIDPYDHYLLTLRYYVDTGYQIQPEMSYQTPDLTASVLEAYRISVTDGFTMQLLSQGLDIDINYLFGAITSPPISNTNIFSVCFYSPSEELAQAALPILEQQIEDLSKQFNQTITAHTLTVIERNVITHVQSDLVTIQNNHSSQLATLESELQLIKSQCSESTAIITNGTNIKFSLTSIIKFFILGAFAGIVLSIIVLVAKHLASGKVYSCRTFSNRTGVKIIGAMPIAVGPVDKFIRKLENREQADAARQAEILAVNIRNRCSNCQHILLTGHVPTESRSALHNAISTALPGAQVSNAEDILKSACALDALANCDAVILVEQCNISTYHDVNRRVEVINDHKKQLLGCVLLDG